VRIIVAMTGATGAIYGVRLLVALSEHRVERHLILSRWAEATLLKETGMSAREVGALATVVHHPTTRELRFRADPSAVMG
jgi:3-polyprenyl-4-hydroxybenzoate decarboxylase